MPIYEYLCPACDFSADLFKPHKEMKTPNLPCQRCGEPMEWAGLSVCNAGKEQRFAAIMQDGSRIPGSLNRSAPLRRRS